MEPLLRFPLLVPADRIGFYSESYLPLVLTDDSLASTKHRQLYLHSTAD